MAHRNLAEVAARVKAASKLLPGEAVNAEDEYTRLESVCIAVLDSEHTDFIPGELQEYLETILYARRLELGLVEFPEPQEQ